MMSKREFIELADLIIYERGFGWDRWKDVNVESLAKFCKQSNSRFNKVRWLAYINGECGPNGGAISPAKQAARGGKICGRQKPLAR